MPEAEKKLRTFDIVFTFYQETRILPLKGSAKDQLKRAAQSIALNLAEGRGRVTLKEQKRFFQIALGSLRECQAVLELEELTDTQAWNTLDCLGAHLFCLIKNAR